MKFSLLIKAKFLSSSFPHVLALSFPLSGLTSSANHGVLASSYSYTLFIWGAPRSIYQAWRATPGRGLSVAFCLFRTNSPHCECVVAIEAIPHRMFLRLYLM